MNNDFVGSKLCVQFQSSSPTSTKILPSVTSLRVLMRSNRFSCNQTLLTNIQREHWLRTTMVPKTRGVVVSSAALKVEVAPHPRTQTPSPKRCALSRPSNQLMAKCTYTDNFWSSVWSHCGCRRPSLRH